MIENIEINICPATKDHCYSIAELALIAGDGIPAYFWAKEQHSGKSLEDVGALRASHTDTNFSYTNTYVAIVNSKVAAMILGYVLAPTELDDISSLPGFIQPMLELEQEVPGSFYINMLATYPAFRSKGLGRALMSYIEKIALQKQCSEISLQVFEENEGAVRFYERIGFAKISARKVIQHASHPYSGNLLLLTKPVN